jgi:uroporphyrinogen III methyltransferase/synthase
MALAHKVYLVGAGPGDPGLITVRGAELLQHADVVLYDLLANKLLLRLMKPTAEAICVGKRANHHFQPQEEINQLLVKLWREGKTVVRLKGGDPFVFGRGGEEALTLARAGVPFEVVPGVTAGVAGLAYAGIPATFRGLAVSATMVTGHEDPTKENSELDWKKLAACGGTLVVYMGVSKLAAITNSLMEGGMPGDTPAALVRMATFPEQRVLSSTLSDIADEAKREGMKPPAIFCTGRVLNLRSELNWFEGLPLFGRRIVVTRPREQISQQAGALETLGAQVIEHPAIDIVPPDDYKEMDEAISRLSSFDFVFFTSINGVKHFFQRLYTLGHDARKLAGCRVGVIGPGTGKSLEPYGISPDFMPGRYTSAEFARALVDQFTEVKGKTALLPRADIAPDYLLKDLEKAGMTVKEIIAYRTVTASDEIDKLKDAFEGREIHAVTFASSSAAQSFIDSMGADFLKAHKGKSRFVSIGPVTTQTLSEAGFPPDAEAKEHTIPGLTEALMKTFAS